MSFLRTKLGTDFKEPSNWWQRLLNVDTANPGYRNKYHLICTWLIEFDDNGDPWREIGLDEHEKVVVAGPSDENYGFWLDTNMRIGDFTGEPVDTDYFERMWSESGVLTPSAT